MIIEKDTKMLIHSETRGVFYAKARRSFSLDEDIYPLTVLDPMDARCIRGEELSLRAEATTVDLVEDEMIYNEEPQVETETEIEIEDEPDGYVSGRYVSFGFSE